MQLDSPHSLPHCRIQKGILRSFRQCTLGNVELQVLAWISFRFLYVRVCVCVCTYTYIHTFLCKYRVSSLLVETMFLLPVYSPCWVALVNNNASLFICSHSSFHLPLI